MKDSKAHTTFTSNNVMTFNFGVVTLPKLKEVKGKEWVYYGEHNDYPYYLVDLFNNSAKNNAVITGKTNYICGQGVSYTQSESIEANAKTQNFILNPNRFESLNDVVKKVTTDFEISNGAYLKLVPNRLKNGFAEVYHIDFTKVRSNKTNSRFYVSDEWLTDNCSEDYPYGNINSRVVPTPYDAWDYKSFDKEYIVFIKTYRPSLKTYTLPDYTGALTWIEVDKRIGNFHLNNLNNGFSSSHIINFNNGTPEKEEQKEIEKKFKDKFTSEQNAGKFVLTFSDDNTKAPTVITLTPSDLDKQFDLLNKTCMQEVMTGHKIVSPMLFGIKEAGQLGGRTELVEAYQLFTNGYVANRRAVVMDVINDIGKSMGLLPMYIDNIKPIGIVLDNASLTQIMSKEELRKEAGLPEIEAVQSNRALNTINAINSLSPLVANKVLESLSVEEIRSLVGLDATTAPIPTAMNEHDRSKELTQALIDAVEEDANETVEEFSVEDFENYETIKSEYLDKHKFADIRDLKKAILETIQLNPSITVNELAKLVEEDKTIVQRSLDSLVKDEYLTPLKKGYEVTEKGTKYVTKILDTTKNTPLQEYELYTVWQYREKSGIPKAQQSREFCVKMLEATQGAKVITEEKIQSISQKYYGNAWEALIYKGGFYTNPKTKETTRDCRHEWKAVIKRRNIKK